jgi:hypothetical protein
MSHSWPLHEDALAQKWPCTKQVNIGYRVSGALAQEWPCAKQVKHALSVSHNKLGDMQHWAGDVAGALHCYEQALALRRELAGAECGVERPEPGTVARQLDLAVSLVKVADAQLALEDASHAELLLAEARQLAEAVAAAANPEDKAVMAKLKGVQAHLGIEL